VLTIALFTCCSDDPASPAKDDNQLEYVTPEEVGYSSLELDQARQFAEQSGYAAVMALYDGKVFFSWGDSARNFDCHSIRKPFLNALYGIHTAQGTIDLTATLEELGIDDIPPQSDRCGKAGHGAGPVDVAFRCIP